IWLASSLLADGLAIAGQAILAGAFAAEDYGKVTATASRVLQLCLVLGLGLLAVLETVLPFTSRLFTNDDKVLRLIRVGIPVSVAIVSIICLLSLSSSHGFIGIWVALTVYMSLRAFAGFLRIGTGTGPWSFLRAKQSGVNH
ncbi:hypothetical protein CRG98_039540, partial [Punica granatum]